MKSLSRSKTLKDGYKNGRIKPFWLGKKHSRESNLKRSLKLKGKVNSPETREKISKAKVGIPHFNQRGELNGNWKGGISPTYQKRRAEMMFRNGGAHSIGEWESLKAKHNWCCVWCGKREPEIKLSKDHIVPVTSGGSNNIENIQPLCTPCNSRKNNKTIFFIFD